MRRLSLAVLALALLTPADAGPPVGKAEAAGLARPKGTWKLMRLQVGKKSSELRVLEWTLVFDGDRWAMKHPDGTGGGKVRLDLKKVPHRRDLTGEKGATLFCTYRLDQGQLRLCWWSNEKERQSTLDPEKQDPPGVLLGMERPKDAGPVLDGESQDRNHSPGGEGSEINRHGIGAGPHSATSCTFPPNDGMRFPPACL